jgi:hypothetical protein
MIGKLHAVCYGTCSSVIASAGSPQVLTASLLLLLAAGAGPIWQKAAGPSQATQPPTGTPATRRHSVFGRASVEYGKTISSPRLPSATPGSRTRAASYAGQSLSWAGVSACWACLVVQHADPAHAICLRRQLNCMLSTKSWHVSPLPLCYFGVADIETCVLPYTQTRSPHDFGSQPVNLCFAVCCAGRCLSQGCSAGQPHRPGTSQGAGGWRAAAVGGL